MFAPAIWLFNKHENTNPYFVFGFHSTIYNRVMGHKRSVVLKQEGGKSRASISIALHTWLLSYDYWFSAVLFAYKYVVTYPNRKLLYKESFQKWSLELSENNSINERCTFYLQLANKGSLINFLSFEQWLLRNPKF